MKKEWLVFLLFILMLAGLLWSRALLSIIMGAWMLFGLLHYKSWLPHFRSDGLLLWAFAPLLMALLGCWQSPFARADLDYLFTLSAYPAVAMAVRSFSVLQLPNNNRFFPSSPTITHQWLMHPWIYATVIAALYPLLYYVTHIHEAALLYGTGRSLPTFMDTDHVRFGMLLCIAFLFTWIVWKQNKVFHTCLLVFFSVCILLFAIRTAWVILIVFLVILVLFKYWQVKKRLLGMLLMVLLLLTAIGTIAYFGLPTVRQKLAYSLYDWRQYQPHQYDATLSDGTRRAINHAAWNAIQQHGQNIGWSAIPATLQTHFSQLHQGITTGFGWPFNQWLFWWMGSGWWGMLLMTIWLVYPIYAGLRQKNAGLICCTLAILLSCIVECTLGYQYGVFLHVWGVALLWRKR